MSSRTIRPRNPCHAQCRLWDTLLRCGVRFLQWRRTRNSVKERDPFAHGQMESSNTSLQEVELIPSCSRQAHSNRPGIGYNYVKKMDVFSSTLCSIYDSSTRRYHTGAHYTLSRKTSMLFVIIVQKNTFK